MDRFRTGPYLSRYPDHCEGASDPGRYVVLLKTAAAKAPVAFSSPSSGSLDEIVAFDAAEAAGPYMGQINLIEVSSFCGVGGLIWGYDLARSESLRDARLLDLDQGGRKVPVFDGRPLSEASRCLLGTADRRKFPIRPGSLCPAAYKTVICRSPGIAFGAFGVGIAADRSSSACVFMEDGGIVAPGSPGDGAGRRLAAARRVAGSILAVAANQRLTCAEIFVLYDEIEVGPGEVGCALPIVPYVRLAKKAVPRGGFARLRRMTLGEWLRETGRRAT